MSSAIPSPVVHFSDRAHLLRKQMDGLLSGQRRFSKTISISNEIDAWIPWRGLPLGCIHQAGGPALAGGIAFAALLAARIPSSSGEIVYAAPGRGLHPLGLLPYGIRPERLIQVTARRAQNLAWAVLEALRCPQVGGVLAVLRSADLTLCRRFQLAAEENGTTGFLLYEEASPAAASSVASVITRWRIDSTQAPPGSAFEEPCWDIELPYCRGGQPGRWSMAWRNGQLQPLRPSAAAMAAKPAQRVSFSPAGRMAG